MWEAIAADMIAAKYLRESEYEAEKCKGHISKSDYSAYGSYLLCATARALNKCMKTGSFDKLADVHRNELLLAEQEFSAKLRDDILRDKVDNIGAWWEAGECSTFRYWCELGGRYTYIENPIEPALRIAPVAYAARTETETVNLVRIIAGVTHKTPHALQGAEAVAVAIYLALNGHTKREIKESIAERYEGCITERALEAFFSTASFEGALMEAAQRCPEGEYQYEMCIAGAVAGAYYHPDCEILCRRRMTKYVSKTVRDFERDLPLRIAFNINTRQDKGSLWLGERMAKAFEEGCFVEKNPKIAHLLAKKCLGLGNKAASNILAKHSLYGEACAADVEKGIEILERNAAEGNAVACCTLGEYYLNGKAAPLDKNKAFNCFKAGKECDDYACYLPYLKCLAFGWGTEQMRELAFEQLSDFVASPCARSDAFSLIGRFYEEGWGGAEVNYEKACYYYLLGLLNDYARDEITRDGDCKIETLLKCCNENSIEENPESENGLGRLYEQGRYFPKDEKKAFEYYRKASKAGDSMGSCNLGRCYLFGIHVQKDLSKARMLFVKAVKKDSGCEGKEAAEQYLTYCDQLLANENCTQKTEY